MTDADKPAVEVGKTYPQGDTQPPEFAFLSQRLGIHVLRFTTFRGDLSIAVDASVIVQALEALRDEFHPAFNYLSFITAEHWIEPQTPYPLEPPAFQVIYCLEALPGPGTRLLLTVAVKDTPDTSVPSVTTVYPSANWQEREVFDLFGIAFTDHPNLTRILTPETYPEHPLRRDFPLQGTELLEFQDRLVAEWNVAEERDYRGKFGDPWMLKVFEQQEGRISLKRIGDQLTHGPEAELPGDLAQSEQKVPDLIRKPKKPGSP
jgi:NADH-quinone oxidoreductase subunit C